VFETGDMLGLWIGRWGAPTEKNLRYLNPDGSNKGAMTEELQYWIEDNKDRKCWKEAMCWIEDAGRDKYFPGCRAPRIDVQRGPHHEHDLHSAQDVHHTQKPTIGVDARRALGNWRWQEALFGK
jgi:hypothetical protein